MTDARKLELIVELFNRENCPSALEFNCYFSLPIESREKLLSHAADIAKRNSAFYRDLRDILDS